MPNIDTILSQIRTAIYGKDVRENIALGIEQCYNDGSINQDQVSSSLTAAYIGMLLNSAGEYVLQDDDIEQGNYNLSTYKKYDSNSRLRVKSIIPVAPNTKITVESANIQYYVSWADSVDGDGSTGSSWKAAGTTYTKTFTEYKYLAIVFRISDSATVTPSDYNCVIRLENQMKYFEPYKTRYQLGPLMFKYGGYDPTNGFVLNKKRFLSEPYHFGDKILSISVDSPCQIIIYKGENDVYTNIRGWINRKFFIHTSNDYDYMIMVREVIDGSEVAELDPKCLSLIDIHEIEDKYIDIGHGLNLHQLEWINGYLTNSGDAVTYSYSSERIACSPIKIPKSGLRISYNPIFSDPSLTCPSIKIAVVSLVDSASGFEFSHADSTMYAASRLTTYYRYGMYIPYVENGYAIVAGYAPSSVPIDEVLCVYSGDINDNGGRLPGLHPATAIVSNGVLSIGFGNINSIVTTSRYYGGAVNLAHIKKMYCGPKYTIVAVVYKENPDGTYECIDRVWSGSGGNTAIPNGVQYIDFTKYGSIDGLVLYAVQCVVRYCINDEGNADIEFAGMGVMNGYDDVYANVYAEYKNGCELSFMDGLDPRISDNVHYYSHYTVPNRFPVSYVNYHEPESQHVTYKEYDASPAFYAGSYETMTPFLAVSPKSYYTAMQNPNSRCYDYRNSGYMGYGLSCTDFCSVMTGFLENYPNNDNIANEHYKFEKISDNWDYRTQMDLLRPGDWLIRNQPYPLDAESTEVRGHAMMVYEIIRVKGAVQYINLMEAGYPYTRFTALVSDKYYSILGNNSMESINQTFSRFGQYIYVRRPKPQYIGSIRNNWDMSKFEVGTLMCDRGTDSVYCLLKDGTMRHIYVSCSDDNASKIYIYRLPLDQTGDDIYVGSVDISSTRINDNDLRVTDIARYVTVPGYYKLRTVQNTSATVQESFFVPELLYRLEEDPNYNPNDPSTINRERDIYRGTFTNGVATANIPNYDDLLYVEAYYKHTYSNGTTTTKTVRTYLKSEIQRDENLNCGTFELPYRYGGSLARNQNDTHSYIRAIYFDPRYGIYYVDNLEGRGMTSEFRYDANKDA